MLEHFKKWADAINNDDQEWSGCNARYDRKALIVMDNDRHAELARIDFNDGRYDISGINKPVVEKLTIMTQPR